MYSVNFWFVVLPCCVEMFQSDLPLLGSLNFKVYLLSYNTTYVKYIIKPILLSSWLGFRIKIRSLALEIGSIQFSSGAKIYMMWKMATANAFHCQEVLLNFRCSCRRTASCLASSRSRIDSTPCCCCSALSSIFDRETTELPWSNQLFVPRNSVMRAGLRCSLTWAHTAMPILESLLVWVFPSLVRPGASGWRAARSSVPPSRHPAFVPRI